MYQIYELPNGVQIIAEKIPYVRSISFGIWIASGTRHEGATQNGISHFIEHMLFKGTEKSDAETLANRMDMLGGQINAFTSKETTCLYGRVLDADIKSTADMFADMFFNSRFAKEDVEVERGVIFEEIDMLEDTPEELVVEKLLLGTFANSPLGMPILGTRETLSTIDGHLLSEYRKSHYTGKATVISLAGNYQESDIDHIKALFGDAPREERTTSVPSSYVKTLITEEKQTEQSHIAIAFPGLSYTSEKRFALSLLNNIVGGSMSSRLFQRVREQLGLCYNIGSFLSSHEEVGVLGIYIGTGRKTERSAMEETGAVLSRIAAQGVSEEEMQKAKSQVKSSMLMSLESTSSRMNNMGRGLLLQGEVNEPEKVARIYEDISTEEVSALAAELLDPQKASISLVSSNGNAQADLDWLLGGFEKSI